MSVAKRLVDAVLPLQLVEDEQQRGAFHGRQGKEDVTWVGKTIPNVSPAVGGREA